MKLSRTAIERGWDVWVWCDSVGWGKDGAPEIPEGWAQQIERGGFDRNVKLAYDPALYQAVARPEEGEASVLAFKNAEVEVWLVAHPEATSSQPSTE